MTWSDACRAIAEFLRASQTSLVGPTSPMSFSGSTVITASCLGTSGEMKLHKPEEHLMRIGRRPGDCPQDEGRACVRSAYLRHEGRYSVRAYLLQTTLPTMTLVLHRLLRSCSDCRSRPLEGVRPSQWDRHSRRSSSGPSRSIRCPFRSPSNGLLPITSTARRRGSMPSSQRSGGWSIWWTNAPSLATPPNTGRRER